MATTAPRQFLTYHLGAEEHAIDILRVAEIRRMSAITAVPNTAPYVRGVMNVRGTVVPVVDLRLRLGLEARAYDRWTVIVMVTLDTKLIGMVVDAVDEVVTLEPSDLHAPPEFAEAIDASLVSAMSNHAGRLIAIIDLERVLRIDEIVGASAS